MSGHVAVCFFGITRSLRYTFPSIQSNILDPAHATGPIRVYAHFFKQIRVENTRSGENGFLDADEYRLLKSDWLALEDPGLCLDAWGFETLKSYGDSWQDDFSSLRNLVHQLHSLRQVTQAALADGAETCIFCRPDLRCHDSLAKPLRRALGFRTPVVQLPYWQCWEGGLNDRFAICSSAQAIRAYGLRIEEALNFCQNNGPLHSERLLAHALRIANIDVRKISTRAGRVRLGGQERYEDFLPPWLSIARNALREQGLAVANRLGLRRP